MLLTPVSFKTVVSQLTGPRVTKRQPNVSFHPVLLLRRSVITYFWSLIYGIR